MLKANVNRKLEIMKRLPTQTTITLLRHGPRFGLKIPFYVIHYDFDASLYTVGHYI